MLLIAVSPTQRFWTFSTRFQLKLVGLSCPIWRACRFHNGSLGKTRKDLLTPTRFAHEAINIYIKGKPSIIQLN